MNAEVYKFQNSAIHEARSQLEEKGILDPWASLDQLREMAAEINGGIRSVSRLSLEERRELIDQLIELGANVRNPGIYDSDLKTEAAARGVKRKVLNFTQVTEKQLRWVDGLAARVQWSNPNAYTCLQERLLGVPRPRTKKQLQRLAYVIRGILNKQEKNAAQGPAL